MHQYICMGYMLVLNNVTLHSPLYLYLYLWIAKSLWWAKSFMSHIAFLGISNENVQDSNLLSNITLSIENK